MFFSYIVVMHVDDIEPPAAFLVSHLAHVLYVFQVFIDTSQDSKLHSSQLPSSKRRLVPHTICKRKSVHKILLIIYLLEKYNFIRAYLGKAFGQDETRDWQGCSACPRTLCLPVLPAK